MSSEPSDAAPTSGTGRALVLATLVNRLDILGDVLHRVGWEVETCRSPHEALDALRGHAFDAVFCDEYLRGASPSGVLAWTHRLAPHARFYLIAMSGTEHAFAGRHRPHDVVAFPPSEDSVPKPHGHTQARPRTESASHVPLEGNTGLVPLVDLIEMLGVIGRSAIVSVGSAAGRSGRGRVYLRDGGVVHADFATPDGEQAVGLPALAELMMVGDVDFAVLPFAAPARRTVHLSTPNAVTEAARMHDVQNRDRGMFAAVGAGCPDVSAIAVGYALAQQPATSQGTGGVALFATAQGLLKRSQELVGRTTRLAVEGDDGAYALARFGDDNLIVARAPRGHAGALLAGLETAIGTLPT